MITMQTRNTLEHCL